MMTDFRAATKREIHNVNPIGVNDGKASTTALRTCARLCGVVAKLEDMTSLSKR
jgi:hypothetical protein